MYIFQAAASLSAQQLKCQSSYWSGSARPADAVFQGSSGSHRNPRSNAIDAALSLIDCHTQWHNSFTALAHDSAMDTSAASSMLVVLSCKPASIRCESHLSNNCAHPRIEQHDGSARPVCRDRCPASHVHVCCTGRASCTIPNHCATLARTEQDSRSCALPSYAHAGRTTASLAVLLPAPSH